MDLRNRTVIMRSEITENKENVKRSLSKRKSLLGIARLGTPAKKKLKKFAGELTAKVEKAAKLDEIKPKDRWQYLHSDETLIFENSLH